MAPEVVAPAAEASAPKRRTTRKPAASSATEAPAAEMAPEVVAPAAEASAPKRRTTRKPVAPAAEG
jgi:hypothetical protein